MQNRRSGKSNINVAVVGAGYWGKNLVRNFHDLGVLSVVCDANRSVEAGCRHDYENVRFCQEYDAVLSDPSIDAVALADGEGGGRRVHGEIEHQTDSI